MQIVTPEMHDARAVVLHELKESIVRTKRPVYTVNTSDVHRNFRVSAALKGPTVTLGSEIATHLVKQIGAVVDILCNPNNRDTELATRFADAVAYLELAYSAVAEGIAHATSEQGKVGFTTESTGSTG